MTAATGAVFLSYAIEDSEAAQRIVDALREVGVEVWFDKSDLRGGDVWDRAIRDQIRRCRLFMPVISATTERRDEGYFRREWNLAVDRAQDMAEGKSFLFPVVIDGTTEAGAAVPEKFRQAQWSRLPGGRPQMAFVSRVVSLLKMPLAAAREPAASGPVTGNRNRASDRRGLRLGWGVLALLLVLGSAYAIRRVHPPVAADAAAGLSHAAEPDPENASEQSVAVLPFSDLSEKHDAAYLGDGLAEALTDRLTRVPDLQVAARTSAFHFTGSGTPVTEIGAALRVAYVLEGSVREGNGRLRITARLLRVRDEREVISRTYDSPTADVFKVQDQIAGEVLASLRIAPADVPRTRSVTPWEAYKAYLEGQRASKRGGERSTVIAAYRASLALDPNFAPAWAALADALTGQMDAAAADPAPVYAEARSAAQRALALDPDLVEAQRTLAFIRSAYDRDFEGAGQIIAHAMQLEPGNAGVLQDVSRLSGYRGEWDRSLEYARRAIARDPLSVAAHESLAQALHCSGQYHDAVGEWQRALQLEPSSGITDSSLGRSLMMEGRLDEALQSASHDPNEIYRLWMVAQIQHAMGREADSNQSLAEYKLKYVASNADGIAWIYAVQGHLDEAFAWFGKAYEHHNQGLIYLKCFPEAPAFTRDSRFKTLLRKVNLPE